MQWVYDVPPSVEAQSNWPTIVGLSLASTILMVMICAARLWTKRRCLGVEDWLIIVAMVCNIVYAAFTIIQTRYGLGLPVPLRPAKLHSKYTLYNYVTRGPNIVAVAVSKIALCISALKMIRQTSFKGYRAFIIGLAAFTGAYWFALCIIEVFTCRPFKKVLDDSIPGYCVPYAPPLYAIWIINVFDDVLVYLLPVPLITRLNLDRAVKIGLSVSFAMGLFTTIFSILKITQIHRIVAGDHNSSLLVLYTTLEGNVGTISASWPVIRGIILRLPVVRELTEAARHRSRSRMTNESSDYAQSSSLSKKHGTFASLHGQPSDVKASSRTHTKNADGDGDESDEIGLMEMASLPPASAAAGRAEGGADSRDRSVSHITKTVSYDVKVSKGQGQSEGLGRKGGDREWG